MRKLLAALLMLSVLAVCDPAYAFTTNTHATALASASSQSWSIADGSQTGLEPATNISISLWLKATSLPASGHEMDLVSKWGSSQSYILALFNSAGTPQLLFGIRDSTNNQRINFHNWSPSTGVWYHLIITLDHSVSTNNLTYYVDGVQQGSTESLAGTGILGNAAAFAIGYDSVAGEPFNGAIDDVRVWGRVLSSTEASSLHSDPCNFTNGSNLGGEWLFDNTGNDSSGNGNDLTNNNSATFTTSAAYVCAAPSVTPNFGDVLIFE